MQKTVILFSGGKDSFYSLLKAQEISPIEYLVSIKAPTGDTQLHAGPEASEELRKTQLELIGLPYKEITLGSDRNYLHELYIQLNNLVKQDSITHLVTGDLWHPYTSGIGDMLAGALGVELVRPAREACPEKESGVSYMNEIISMGIKSLIVSVRKNSLPENFVGKTIDKQLLNELIVMDMDVAAEGGEYQSFVLAAPNMKGEIVIDSFDIGLVDGKNMKEKFYRMSINKFHTEI